MAVVFRTQGVEEDKVSGHRRVLCDAARIGLLIGDAQPQVKAFPVPWPRRPRERSDVSGISSVSGPGRWSFHTFRHA
ncbi:hypothetical protein GCM10010277_85880 [Streptomyces longisporoflavus]|nr:hypothetical protein GCM10010277_85880 [Streptomyces longisporoflavus]